MDNKQSTLHGIPPSFLSRMAGLLGDEYGAFVCSLDNPPVTGLRVNSLKISPEEFISKSPIGLNPIPWCRNGYSCDTRAVTSPGLGKHPYHAAGLYYLQEPSAMAAAEILSPQPGERVLDIAAAPGGKATHLAALMNNTGLLVANEIHPRRVWDLAENIERCGITNTVITNETPHRFAGHFSEYFDRVLVDAPCSGEGMFRKSDAARQEWYPELVNHCAVRQISILEDTAHLVRVGGRLVYTTCTFSVEENEAVISQFLVAHPEFDIIQITFCEGFRPAMPEWLGLKENQTLKRAVRVWPHLANGEGHFVALLERKDHGKQKLIQPGNPRSTKKSHKKVYPSKPMLALLEGFWSDTLTSKINQTHLDIEGSYVYLLPEEPIALEGLKVIRPGLWLGSFQKDRFIPSHSLAMAMDEKQARDVLRLQLDDTRIFSYFAGEQLIHPGEDGWVLITVEGYPIGWGKRTRGTINNYYPRGLQRRA